MSRERDLLKNTGIIAIGTLSSKLFTFLLLPVYTSLLHPEDYGVVDVLSTICQLALYIITLQLESAVFRFIIENRNSEELQKKYISSAVCLEVAGLTVASLLFAVFNTFKPIAFLPVFLLCLWSNAFSLLMLNLVRGIGDNVLYSFASFIITLSGLITNLVLILGFRVGAIAILIAIVVSNAIGGMFVFFKIKLWRLLSVRYFDALYLKQMLNYSLPLVPNSLSWWIANVSDRLVIAGFLGSMANGIYAAANKIPVIYSTLFHVYNLAWMESISLAVLKNDYVEYISDIWCKSYKVLSFLILGMLCGVSLFFGLLIGKEYAEAYLHVSILLVSVFINSLCSLEGGILAAFKDSKATGKTTVFGAIVNIITNLMMVNYWGLFAASVSTLISYMAIYFYRKKVMSQYEIGRAHV